MTHNTSDGKEDFICLTGIARHKNPEAIGLVMSHWLSTRYTTEFMGLWEKMNNPDFSVTEFRSIKNEAAQTALLQNQSSRRMANERLAGKTNSASTTAVRERQTTARMASDVPTSLWHSHIHVGHRR